MNMEGEIDEQVKRAILKAQRNEITEYHVYRRLAERIKDQHNKEVLARIGEEEMVHANFWRRYSGKEVAPSRWRIWKYLTLSRLFGLTFAVKLMERGEEDAKISYKEIARSIPEAMGIAEEENRHENELVELIDEERLRYVGSMVLGLNDALVELTGALAGFALAFRDPRVVAMAGLITGIAASMSMAASEYLSTKTEGGDKNPLRASIYTGTAYLITVIILILPFLILGELFLSLGLMIIAAILVIFIFTYYISIAKDLDFKRRFLEMATISLGITAITFIIGSVVRLLFGLDI